jgi:hypothetical protein
MKQTGTWRIRIGNSCDRFDADCQGPLTVLALDTARTLPLARQLVRSHPLRTLDAIHLAVALTDATERAAGDPVALITRDPAQADVAGAVGLVVG